MHTHGKGPGLYGRLAARAFGIPAVHTFHGIHYGSYREVGQDLYLALERRLSRLTHTVINVSRSQEMEGLALRLFRPEQSVVVVNGIDVEETGASDAPIADPPRDAGARPPTTSCSGCVSRWDPVKRFEILLEAVRRLASRVPRLAPPAGGRRQRRGPDPAHRRRDGSRRPRDLHRIPREPGSCVWHPRCLRGDLAEGRAAAGAARGHVRARARRRHGCAGPSRRGRSRSDRPSGAGRGQRGARGGRRRAGRGRPERRRLMGEAGRQRVLVQFGIQTMADHTADVYRAAAGDRRRCGSRERRQPGGRLGDDAGDADAAASASTPRSSAMARRVSVCTPSISPAPSTRCGTTSASIRRRPPRSAASTCGSSRPPRSCVPSAACAATSCG